MMYPRAVLAYAAMGLAGVVAVTAQPPGVPVATAVPGTTSMCSADTVEYSGRWSIPNNGITVPTLEDCAVQCEADPQCSGATWIGWEPSDGDSPPNCWFKAWDPAAAAVPCQPSNLPPGRTYAAIITLPTGATDCATIPYLTDPSIDCVTEKETFGEFSGSGPVLGLPAMAPVEELAEEPEVAGPMAAGLIADGPMDAVGPVEPTGAVPVAFEGLDTLEPPYIAYSGADYSPNQQPAPLVPVENVMTGFVADSVLECASACNADPSCNAASYYGNNPPDTWPAGFTCWMKALGVPCELPTDYEVAELPGTVFLLAQENCGVVAPIGVMPEMGPSAALLDLAPGDGPMMIAPLEIAPEMGPADGPLDAFGFVADGPGLAPLDTTRDFTIDLAPTDATALTPAGADPVPVDPIQGPLLTTDVPAPEPAAAPLDAGTGLDTGIGGVDDPALDDSTTQEATTVDGVADGAVGLSAALASAAAVVAAACLMAW